MDATRLAFPTAHFDSVVAPYVLTVVPDPAATLDELARVVKVGGEIVLVNHVGAEIRSDCLDRTLAGAQIGGTGLEAGISLVHSRRLDFCARRFAAGGATQNRASGAVHPGAD